MSIHTGLACLFLVSGLLGQGTERLTLEALGHPTQKKALVAMPPTRLEWLPDGALLQTRREGEQVTLLRVDPGTWAARSLVDPVRLLAALVTAGLPETEARPALGRGGYIWNEPRTAFLLEAGEQLFLLELKTATARCLLSGKPEEPSFSPDGTQVAFLRGNDLYRVDIATAQETRLTRGGSETVFNGRLDWVYQEEIYGRARGTKAYWWSPDSKRLAFLSLDDTRVPVFTLADDRFQPQKLQQARYPKAGDPNPVVRLGVVDLAGHTTWMEDPHPGRETLITRVTWDQQGRLAATITDRIQSWMEFRRFESPGSSLLVKEQGGAWVDPEHHGDAPLFLKDGGFLWESNRTGHHHVYRYDAKGTLRNAITSGEWDVRKLRGLDEARGVLYFDATERSPIGVDTYRVSLDGQGLRRLTERLGTHSVRFNPTYSAFLDTWSDIHTPPQQSLHDGSGKFLRHIDANPSNAWKALALGKISFQQVRTRDGFPMETMLILPVGFDPAKKYPVFQEIYGGPGTPEVRDSWSRSMQWYQFLAQNGIAVWVCDNRSASGKGLASAFGIHRNLGAQELQDQLDGLAWLRTQGWADMDRLCLDGWSYGGFMTTYALTHSKAWKVGIAGAPVTDWKLYDSVYTERYMGLPADNPKGYETSSVLKAAKDLSGKLLLLHGTLDDNVHPQNSVMLIDALQKAGHPCQFVLLPGSAHGPRSPEQIWAVYQARWDFLSKNL